MWGGTAESRGAEMQCNCIPRGKYPTPTQRDRDKAPLDIGGQPRREQEEGREEKREGVASLRVLHLHVLLFITVLLCHGIGEEPGERDCRRRKAALAWQGRVAGGGVGVRGIMPSVLEDILNRFPESLRSRLEIPTLVSSALNTRRRRRRDATSRS
jgi:hypothetical protein